MLDKNRDLLIQWILLIDAFNYSEEKLEKENIDELEKSMFFHVKRKQKIIKTRRLTYDNDNI